MNILYFDVQTDVLSTNAYGAGALVRIERASSQTGNYSEIGTTAVVAGQPTITYYDATGTLAHWYKIRYSKATPVAPGDWSEYSAVFQASSVGYTDVAAVKARLGMGTAAGTADAVLSTLVTEVNAWIDNRLGRRVGPGGSALRSYDGDGSSVLYVADGVQSVYSLVVYDQTRGAAGTVASTDYYVDPPVQLRRPGEPGFFITFSDNPVGSICTFTRGKRTVDVTAEWGWPSVPLELQAVATKCVVSEWRGRASAGGETFTVGMDGSRTYERYLSYEDRRTLERYASDVPGIG